MPLRTRSVEVMMECLYEQPGYPDLPKDILSPASAIAVAYVYEDGDAPEVIGGGTINILPGRATRIENLDVTRASSTGQVVDVATGNALQTGQVLISARAINGAEVHVSGPVASNGAFNIATPGLAALPGPIDLNLMYGNKEYAVATITLSLP